MTRTKDSFSFVHAADLHLDTPFQGVQADAPFVAKTLRDASLGAFDQIVELALTRKVDFVLFAGDIYDGPERGIRAQTHFRDGLLRLSAAGIRSFIVHGNHDPVENGWSAVSSNWPENITIFGSEETRVVEIIRDGVRIATVQGISYQHRVTLENLSKRLTRPKGPGIHIGLLHCNVGGSASKHLNYSPCTIEDLRTTGLDYLALGHVHERRILTRGSDSGDPWIVYPGNTQARSINETGAKGVYLVTGERGIVSDLEFVACDDIRFTQLDLPIDTCENLTDLDELLLDLERHLIEENDARSVIFRVRLTGHSVLHQLLNQKERFDDLVATIRARARSSTPFCWLEQLIDASSSPIDLREIINRNDFSSDLLETAVALQSDEERRGEVIKDLLEIMPRAFRKELRELFSNAQFVEELFDSAKKRALDEILSER